MIIYMSMCEHIHEHVCMSIATYIIIHSIHCTAQFGFRLIETVASYDEMMMWCVVMRYDTYKNRYVWAYVCMYVCMYVHMRV